MPKISIDLGYGHTKVKCDGIEVKFPTAIERVRTQMIEINDTYSFEGKKYLVGEDALRNAMLTRDYEFIYKYAPIIIAHAVKIVGLKLSDETLEIHTGLSLYDLQNAPTFDTNCVNRKEEFRKRISKFVVDDIQYKNKVKLFAQGQGSWFDYCTSYGVVDNGYDVVIDVGYRTNDVVIFKDGVPSKSNSNADDKGINEIVTELQIILNKKFDVVFTEQEIMTILKEKSIFILGVEKDLTETIEVVIEGFIESFFNSLKAKYGNILKIAKRVIISGGGAYILQDYKDELPSNVVFSDAPMEFANVRGYSNA